MNHIDQLINQHCKEGIKCYKIKDLFRRLKGTPITAGKMKEIEKAGGNVRIFAGGKTVIDAFEEDIPNANVITVPAVLVQSRGVVDFIYCDKPFTFKNEMWAYTADDVISVKYLYYYLKENTQYFRNIASATGSLPQISLNITEDYSIPFPDVEVQKYVVELLDSFNLLMENISIETELRKKQYDYYLNKLFSDLECEVVPLSSIGTLTRGKRFVHADAVEEGLPCIHYGELYTHYGVYACEVKSHIRPELQSKMRYAHKGDVIIVGAGENNVDIGVGVAWDGDYDVAVHDACYTFRHNQNPKYISYFLRTNNYHSQIKRYVAEGKICSISADGLGRAEIPLPTLDAQKDIVEILDVFDKLYYSTEVGLPAEFEQRNKQYEYYRRIVFEAVKKGVL